MRELQRLSKVAKIYRPSEDFDTQVNRYEAYLILKKLKGKKLLEVGGGDGVMTEIFLNKVSHLTVIEPASYYAQTLRKKFGSRVSLCQVLAEKFEPQEKFEEIVLAHLLEHVRSPIYLLQKVKKWLMADGQVHLIVPNGESLHRRIGQKMGLLKKLTDFSSRDKKIGHRRVYTLASITRDIQKAGLKVVKREGIFLKPLSSKQMKSWNPKIISALFKVTEQIPIDWCAELYFICQKRKK